MEEIKRRRILSVTHLHPTDSDDCNEELTSIGINDTETIMCLDTGVMAEPCMVRSNKYFCIKLSELQKFILLALIFKIVFAFFLA